MFNKLIQFILATTSLSPVLFTLWFKEFSKTWNFKDGFYYLIIALILIFLLILIINIAKRKLEIIPITISEISNPNYESIVFILTYFIPLLELKTPMIIFLFILFFVIVHTTNIYHFNPFLGLLGYYQYKIKLKEGLNFILITKKKLFNGKQIKNVIQITNYILLDMEEL